LTRNSSTKLYELWQDKAQKEIDYAKHLKLEELQEIQQDHRQKLTSNEEASISGNYA
jgi:hypothetical protein